MEKGMTNRPCLDKQALELQMRLVCEKNGYDFSKFEDAIKHAFIGWFSRSMATAVFVFCMDKDGKWHILASERGEEAADFRGKWNCVCGYLDYSETMIECAARELYEEVGLKLSHDLFTFYSINDKVTENRQNVTFRYFVKITDRTIDDFEFSKDNNEGKEVGEIKWIPVDEIDNFEWAFDHDSIVKEIFSQKVL